MVKIQKINVFHKYAITINIYNDDTFKKKIKPSDSKPNA